MWNRLDKQLTQKTWDTFVEKYAPVSGAFLQSWEWGELAVGERWVCEEEGERGEGESVGGVATVIYKKIPVFGRYAYCPRGPIVKDNTQKAASELANRLDGIVFLRFDTPVVLQRDPSPAEPVQDDRKIIHTIPIQPPMTRLTDFSLSETDLFSLCHPKLRYNIRLAEKSGVVVRFDMNDIGRVWHLFESTSSRGEFRLHDRAYYERMLTIRASGSCRAFLATAWFENQPIAANIMIDFAGVRTYLHGASSHEHRFLMAPHLLHWELLRDAKAKNFSTYDWWGVSPASEPNHPWAGVSRFKRAFPGQDISFAGTFDFVKNLAWYRLYTLARHLRRMR